MSRPFSLEALLQLARQKHEAAIIRLGQLNQMQQSALGKLELLQQYRRDYQTLLQEAESKGISPLDLNNFQAFLYRLDEAITQQQLTVEQAGQATEDGRRQLQEAQRRMNSFDTLKARHLEAERKLEEKQEQRAQDEYAGRFAARHAAQHPGEQ